MSKYPKDSELLQQVENIYDYKFTERMPEPVREGCKILGAIFSKAIPYFDRYKLYSESVKITEDDLRAWYKDYDTAGPQYRNKLKRMVEKAEAHRSKALKDLETFIDQQAIHMNGWSEEQIEELEQLAEAV